MHKEKKIQKIALLVSCASVLQAAEFLIPSPIPGVKLGLANIITLIVLADMGFIPALEVAILRTVVSSLFLGTFLSPAFVMSLSGALTSTLLMGLTFKYLGFISTSVFGSVAHVLTQLLVVYFLLIRHPGVFVLMPWLGASAVVMGWLTGVIAMNVFARIKSGGITDLLPQAVGPQEIRRPAEFSKAAMPKLIIALLLCVIVLLLSDLMLYALVFVLILAAAATLKAPVSKILSGVKRLRVFLLFSLAIPALFSQGGADIFSFWFIKVTRTGLLTGALFASRLILLMMTTALLSASTPAIEIAGSLRKIISERLSGIVLIAWENIPVFWERSRLYLKQHKFDKTIFKKALPVAINLVALLYAETERAR